MAIGSEEKAVKLTTYLGSLPSRRRTIMVLLAMGFLFGLLTHLIKPAEGDWPLGAIIALISRGADGLLLISMPAIVSAFTITLIKREMRLQKSLFISMACSLIYVLFYSLSMAGGSSSMTIGATVLGFGLAFVLWYAVARVFFNFHWYTSLTLATIQLVFNAVTILFLSAIFVSTDPSAIALKLTFSTLAFLAALYAAFWLVDAPMKRNFGVSGVEAATLFIAQWTAKSKGLEGLFESVGEDVETLVSVMAFRRKEDGKTRECLFVVPSVHYGPFGNLGGSEFPHLIAERLGTERGADVFVFHGAATHDFNPVASDQIEPILDGCRRALAEMKFEKAKGAVVLGKAGTCRANCLISNNNCFIGLTRAPKTTEDLDLSIGFAIRYLAMTKGMGDAAVVDAHNSETGEIMRVYMGDPLSFEYMDSAEAALSEKFKPVPLRMGVHCDDMSDLANSSLGKAGLKTAVFETGGKLSAILLFDANGITPGFRRKIIDEVRISGVDCEIYTTDTHSINAVSGVLNPLGNREDDMFLKRVLDSVETAKSKLSDVETGLKTERIKIKVFGTQQSSELLGTISSIVAVVRFAVPIVFLITALFVLWGITKL